MGIEQTRWDWYQLLARLSAAELAALLAAHYRQQGWQLGAAPVEDRPAALGTHGLELRLMRRGRLQLVWLWPAVAGAVEPPLVHQLTGRMLAQRAESAALVSSLPMDAAARQVAFGQQRLELVDGGTLRDWLESLPEPQFRPLLEGVMRRQPPRPLAAPAIPAPRWRRRLWQLLVGWAVALLLIWAAHWLARPGKPAPRTVAPPAATTGAVTARPTAMLAGGQSTPPPRRASAIELPTVAPTPPPPGTVLRSRAEIRAWQRDHADELKALQESSRSV